MEAAKSSGSSDARTSPLREAGGRGSDADRGGCGNLNKILTVESEAGPWLWLHDEENWGERQTKQISKMRNMF